MSENCNGGSFVDGDISKSRRGPVGKEISVKDADEEFPPYKPFGGFVQIPCVYLARSDISAYLNGSRKPNIPNGTQPKGRIKRKSILKKDESAHQKRLSQKCVVSVFRDDLEKLKASKSWKPALKDPDSDCGDSSCSESEMVCKCKICNKSYNSEKKLLNHQRKKHIIYTNTKQMKHVSFSDHVIIHEVKEYHKCRKCPKIFKNYRSLKQHMKQQHKKRKSYICNYCNKNFAERMIFKVHIKLHCDVCQKLFPSRAKCVDHKRNICRIVKLHKCKSCDKSFYSFMGLKDHSYDHGNPCFICDVCKDHFQNKCMIAHHLSFLHSKERPQSLYTMCKIGNERLYLCNFCDESSVERNVIETHTEQLPDLKNRAMTGYSDHYFCDVCKKTFATEQEMLQHKWTHFLKTTNNLQIRPSNNLTDTAEFNSQIRPVDSLKDLTEPSSLTQPNHILKDMLEKSISPTSLQQHIVKNYGPEIKTIYNINEPLPWYFQPKLILHKLNLDEGSMRPLEFIDITIEPEIHPLSLKKAIVDPRSRKTLISKHRCELCGKYFSTNYCLTRHVSTIHLDYQNLRCRMCEETFVWPSLLRSHKCIRLYHPEMPFDDARPEIHFDNLHETGIDDFNITANDDYMSTIDFEIPAPVVELTEGDTFLSLNQQPMNHMIQEKNCHLQSLGYKLVMQEVPIEF